MNLFIVNELPFQSTMLPIIPLCALCCCFRPAGQYVLARDMEVFDRYFSDQWTLRVGDTVSPLPEWPCPHGFLTIQCCGEEYAFVFIESFSKACPFWERTQKAYRLHRFVLCRLLGTRLV